ncbi:DegV family protein [Clostridium sp. DL1XJH146]
MKTLILTDSSCDLPLTFVEKNIEYLDFIGIPFNLDGTEYFDDFGKTLSHDKFYEKLRNDIIPSTAQINFYTFTQVFKKHYDLGNSIIYLGLSSGLSGTYNNSIMAREEFIEEHPDAKITIIDTYAASIGLGVLVAHAVDMLKNNIAYEELVLWLETNKINSNHWFAVDDLHYLKKGGRISATTAAVGTALNVKPILSMDTYGKLNSYTNVRGRKKSIKYLYKKFKENNTNADNMIVTIGHGNCHDDAYALRELILKDCIPKNIIVSELSATIASHVGPNMLAIAFIGKPRNKK